MQTSKIYRKQEQKMGSSVKKPFFQAKLTVNQPGDAHEQQADAVADQVMRMQDGDMPIIQRMPILSLNNVQRACADCEKEEAQRKETGGGNASGKAAPSIVADVVASGGGQPMEGGTRQFMESRFGQDFSQVRVHTDSKAAESAHAIQARAYTSGRNVVFGAGEYQPNSDSGKRLLAHELVHVGQQGGHSVKRSLTSGLIGGGIGLALGAVGGALIGGSLGGAGGAVAGGIIGGLAGFVAGALIGDSASRQSRGLKETEKSYAQRIYCNSIDYSEITINRGSMFSAGNTPRTTGNMINLTSGQFEGDSLDLTSAGMSVLIHEMGHVWQYQHGGFAYIPSSLIPQAIAGINGQSRDTAYNWREAISNNLPWAEWNAEQQAECISDYNDAVSYIDAHSADPTPSADLLEKYQTAVLADPYIRLVRRGIGAPGSIPDGFGMADPTGGADCPDLLGPIPAVVNAAPST